jgi:hypothetical protein
MRNCFLYLKKSIINYNCTTKKVKELSSNWNPTIMSATGTLLVRYRQARNSQIKPQKIAVQRNYVAIDFEFGSLQFASQCKSSIKFLVQTVVWTQNWIKDRKARTKQQFRNVPTSQAEIHEKERKKKKGVEKKEPKNITM